MTNNRFLRALGNSALFYAFATMFALLLVLTWFWWSDVVLGRGTFCAGEPNLFVRWLEAVSYIFAIAVSPWLFRKFFI